MDWRRRKEDARKQFRFEDLPEVGASLSYPRTHASLLRLFYSMSTRSQELLPSIWGRIEDDGVTAKALHRASRSLRARTSALIRHCVVPLDDVAQQRDLASHVWTSGWPRTATMERISFRCIVNDARRSTTPLNFPWMVLSKGPVELRFVTEVHVGAGVRFGSVDLACMATACPALRDLTLGNTDEKFMFDDQNSMAPTDANVLRQLEVRAL